MASEEGDWRAEDTQVTLPHLGNNHAKRIKAGNSLSDLLDGKGWGHKIANGNFLRAAIRDIVAAEPGYEILSGGTLSGRILEHPPMTKRVTGASWLISIRPSRKSLVSSTSTSRMAFGARAHSRSPRQRGCCRRRQGRYPRGVNHQRGNLRRLTSVSSLRATLRLAP